MKWSVIAVSMLFALTATPLTNAQDTTPLLTDEEGDVTLSLYDTENPMPGGWQALDLVSLRMTEHVDAIHFSLGIVGFPDCQGGTCSNAGDTRTLFNYGENRFMIQTGTNLNGIVYGIFHQMVGDNEFQWATSETLKATANQQTLSYDIAIPRELITDETGSPPRKDTSITNIYTRSYSQVSFGGPDPDNLQEGGSTDMLVTSDQMGIDTPASLPITTGGIASSGPVSITSSAPYRASNGGEGTFRYDLRAIYTGPGEALFDLVFDDVPASWTVEKPNGILRLPSGVPADFSILVTTPFGHQHGGSESFDFKIVGQTDAATWASVELGIHYVTVPQPSGHHPTMWFHSLATPAPFDTINNALGGANGRMYMSTIEEDPGDGQAPVQGWTGTPTNDVFRWSVCMQPELLMGIDVNMTKTGTLEVPFQSTRGQTDATLTGRVLFLGPGDEIASCFSTQYSDRPQKEIATIEAVSGLSFSSSTSQVTAIITPHTDGDYIPYQPGSLLVFELEVNLANTPIGPTPTGPASLDLMPGGWIALPLDEYHDARPQGLVGLADEAPVDENASLAGDQEFVPAALEKESPAASAFVLVGLLAALVLIGRRKN